MSPQKMSDIRMKEISGVDRAANLNQGWLMMKSASQGARSFLSDALNAATGTTPAERTDYMPFDKEAIAADPGAALAYIQGLEKAMAAGSPAPVTEPSEADILAKSLEALPAPAREIMLKAQRDAAEAREELAKQRLARETETFSAVAKSLDALPGVTSEMGETMVKARHGDSAAVDALIESLKKANEVVKASSAFREIGSSSAPSEDSAEGQLMAKAAEIASANPSLSQPEAIEKAASANPDLYAAYRRETQRKAAQ